MKDKTIRILSSVTKFASLGAGLTAYADVIPHKYLPVAMLAFGIASTVKEFAMSLGDQLDDGKKNGSFK